MDLDQNLIVARDRRLNLLALEDVGRTVAGVDDGFHGERLLEIVRDRMDESSS
jgi:hypothetical protein